MPRDLVTSKIHARFAVHADIPSGGGNIGTWRMWLPMLEL